MIGPYGKMCGFHARCESGNELSSAKSEDESCTLQDLSNICMWDFGEYISTLW
jgi:hypothetical protein